ncbi:MAG: hypothetical protein ACPGSG_11480 [Prolixibacteraceae bacterium]
MKKFFWIACCFIATLGGSVIWSVTYKESFRPETITTSEANQLYIIGLLFIHMAITLYSGFKDEIKE